jgi:regulator of sigma E protease
MAVALRRVDGYVSPLLGLKDEPVAVPALGLAYEVTNRVASVDEGSPAAKAGIKPGDRITQLTLIPPDLKTRKSLGIEDVVQGENVPLKVGPGKTSWPTALEALQDWPAGTRVEFAWGDHRKAILEPVPSSDWFNPARGFRFEAQQTFVQGETLGESIELGWHETVNSLTMVLQFVRKIGSQVSPRAIGGPWTIVKQAYYAVSSGMAVYLLFLCLISANLAVVNILPIPVLDGGHMMFLLYEGIRGKPPSERVFVGLSYMGLFLLLVMMVWALGLDFGLIPRQ